MATNKNLATGSALFTGLACVWLAGCTPSAPELFNQGERLVRSGKFADAIQKYEAARGLQPRSALIWNQLGLAYHSAGRANDAAQAYGQALQLDRNLVAARFNLGNLQLEQNNLTGALNELTAFVSLQPNNAEGWIKLGIAHSRARRFDDAERCLSQAARMVPKHPEPMNGLGVVQMQRKRYREAVPYFDSALRLANNYPPALLNLALLNHHHFNNRPVALEKYHAYLATQPPPANWNAVNEIARALDTELHPPAKPAPVPQVATTTPLAPPTPLVNTPPITNPAGKTSAPPVVILTLVTNRGTNLVAKATPVPSQPIGLPAATRKIEVVELPDDPAIKPAQQPKSTPPPMPAPEVKIVAAEPEPASFPETAPTKTEKRGFFQKLNPVRWFGSDGAKTKDEKRGATTVKYTTNSRVIPKSAAAPIVAAPSSRSGGTVTQVASTANTAAPAEVQSTAYEYQRPPPPAFGNREEADKFFAAGLKAHQAGKLTSAVTEYLAATQADPSYFEAYYNLGLAAYDLDHLVRSLSAYETALSIKPTDVNARYNFALALRKAGHNRDAAAELETLLSDQPAEARAHLALGNLYAQQLAQPKKAREHYLKVLSLDPRTSQAADIRYWLSAHP